MSIITANFKHIYQCRRMWLWLPGIFLFGLLQIYIAHKSISMERNVSMGLALSHFWFIFIAGYFAGLAIGSLSADVLSKPFSFTLPGHRHIPQVFVVTVSLIACLGPFLATLWLEPLIGKQKWFAATAVYFLALAVCLILARQSFRESNPRFALTYVLLAAVPFILQMKYDFLGIWITDYPFITIGISLMISVIFYRQLNGDKLARATCGKTITGLASAAWKVTQKRQRAAWQAKGDKPLSTSMVNTFFLDRMKQSAALSTARYCWGVLYERLATCLRIGPGMALLLIMAIMLCYLSMRLSMMFLLPLGIVLGRLRIPIRSSLLLPAGRMERFWGAATLMVSFAGLIISMYLLLIGLSHLIAPIMPDIYWKNTTFTYNRWSGLSLLYAALTLTPLVFAVQILFPRYVMIAIPVIIAPLIIIFSAVTRIQPKWLALFSPTTIIPALLILWALLFLLLRHICLRRSLVGQMASY